MRLFDCRSGFVHDLPAGLWVGRRGDGSVHGPLHGGSVAGLSGHLLECVIMGHMIDPPPGRQGPGKPDFQGSPGPLELILYPVWPIGLQ